MKRTFSFTCQVQRGDRNLKTLVDLNYGASDHEKNTRFSTRSCLRYTNYLKMRRKRKTATLENKFAFLDHLSQNIAYYLPLRPAPPHLMSPSSFFGQLLEMASRAIFDPANCFPAAGALLPGSPRTNDSPARTISEYLEIVPTVGKGFGTIAKKDVDAYTLLFSESPAAVAQGDQYDRSREMTSIGHAYRRMTPGIRARFDALHEGSRPFKTREMRIWKVNAFSWDRTENDQGKMSSAICLDMSRINHSCLPNAQYRANWDKEQMELYSNTRIRAGEEVTICYGSNFDYQTGAERNAPRSPTVYLWLHLQMSVMR